MVERYGVVLLPEKEALLGLLVGRSETRHGSWADGQCVCGATLVALVAGVWHDDSECGCNSSHEEEAVAIYQESNKLGVFLRAY